MPVFRQNTKIIRLLALRWHTALLGMGVIGIISAAALAAEPGNVRGSAIAQTQSQPISAKDKAKNTAKTSDLVGCYINSWDRLLSKTIDLNTAGGEEKFFSAGGYAHVRDTIADFCIEGAILNRTFDLSRPDDAKLVGFTLLFFAEYLNEFHQQHRLRCKTTECKEQTPLPTK